MHGCALVIHRVWAGLKRPMHPVFAWLLTFMFVNTAWVFFRAKTFDGAIRILRGMVDINTAFGQGISSISTSDLSWGGYLSDTLLKFLPTTLVGQIPAYIAISAAFLIITQRNSMELARGPVGIKKLIYGVSLFVVAMYFTLAATSSVFLYFNF